MIDLEKFAKPKQVVVPVRNSSFIYDKKSYSVRGEDGWTLVEIQNNKARFIEPSPLVGCDYRAIQGYTHQNTLIFQNFDVGLRNGLGMQAPLHFNQSQTFESVKAVIWEDHQVYWAEPNYSDIKTIEIKEIYDRDEKIDGLKGITKELRTVFLFHSLERERMRQMIEMAKKAEEHERMMRDVPYRLAMMFERSGGRLISHHTQNGIITVDWTLSGSDYEFNSRIDANTWMILEAGYCMSGEDRRHNITSMVKTAQEYDERDVVVITRR